MSGRPGKERILEGGPNSECTLYPFICTHGADSQPTQSRVLNWRLSCRPKDRVWGWSPTKLITSKTKNIKLLEGYKKIRNLYNIAQHTRHDPRLLGIWRVRKMWSSVKRKDDQWKPTPVLSTGWLADKNFKAALLVILNRIKECMFPIKGKIRNTNRAIET